MIAQYLIARIALTSDAANITFSNIPQSFDDLSMVASLRSDRGLAIDEGKVQINSYTGNTYKYFAFRQYGGTLDSVQTQNAGANWALGGTGGTSPSNWYGCAELYLPSYKEYGLKSWVARFAHANTSTPMANFFTNGGLYGGSRIESITIAPISAGVWKSGSSISLYGVRRDNKLG